LPLIEGAEAVTVLYIGTGETQLERARPALDRVVRHLLRHGVRASGEETPRGDVDLGSVAVARRGSPRRLNNRRRVPPFAAAGGIARRRQP
jgi:hypothetical protein